MTASELPGGTLEPIPANSGLVGDDTLSLLQKCVESAFNWAGGGQHSFWLDDEFALRSKLVSNLRILA